MLISHSPLRSGSDPRNQQYRRIWFTGPFDPIFSIVNILSYNPKLNLLL